ncbi:YjfB family protein [Jeotgalibacillus salarius]|uniref:Putative motility protein n=1 Tax=Jeotgalibacillus salarius TaxID=546023 RepID=A0A4Y8LLK5_9BACL|nr:YjfB family protein [Jeotgalibacillus salarius]TFE03928.1 putative motility protein [Jeotgalibacillus salarius]
MDIALLSMAMSQGQLQQGASVALMKKSMGNMDQQAEGLQKLLSSSSATAIQQAAQPHLGGSIDIKL